MTRPVDACKSKRVWTSRERAQIVADFESTGKTLIDGAEKLYVYECPVADCDGFHLTKQAQEEAS